MAAQLICNQWVAGSTPVTSSKEKDLDSLESGSFLFTITHYLTHVAFSGGILGTQMVAVIAVGHAHRISHQSSFGQIQSFPVFQLAGCAGYKLHMAALAVVLCFPVLAVHAQLAGLERMNQRRREDEALLEGSIKRFKVC